MTVEFVYVVTDRDNGWPHLVFSTEEKANAYINGWPNRSQRYRFRVTPIPFDQVTDWD